MRVYHSFIVSLLLLLVVRTAGSSIASTSIFHDEDNLSVRRRALLPKDENTVTVTPEHAQEEEKGSGAAAAAAGAAAVVTPMIVNGHDVAQEDRYEFFVRGESGCSGALVAADVVLSAAHCLLSFGGSTRIGLYNLLSDEGVEVRKVNSSFVVHPKYVNHDNVIAKNDLMLFKIEPSTLTPIAMNKDASQPVYGQNLTVLGFGLDEDGNAPSVLQKAVLQYTPIDTCHAYWEETVHDYHHSEFNPKSFDASNLCSVSNEEPRPAVCKGDSGGPVFDEKTRTLMGVVSLGNAVCSPNNPFVSARVSSDMKWIYREICELTDTHPGFCDPSPSSTTTDVSPLHTPYPSSGPSPSQDDYFYNNNSNNQAPNFAPTTAPSRNESSSIGGDTVGIICGGAMVLIVALFLGTKKLRASSSSSSSSTMGPNIKAAQDSPTASLPSSASSSVQPEEDPIFFAREIVTTAEPQYDDVSTIGDPFYYYTTQGGGGCGPPLPSSSALPAPLLLLQHQQQQRDAQNIPTAVDNDTDDDDDDVDNHMIHNKNDETRMEVQVPAGKLGMVLDSPNPGIEPPMVQALRSDSVLLCANNPHMMHHDYDIEKGDALLSVNGQDVTHMTTTEVSRIISHLANQPRVLVFRRLRPTTTASRCQNDPPSPSSSSSSSSSSPSISLALDNDD